MRGNGRSGNLTTSAAGLLLAVALVFQTAFLSGDATAGSAESSTNPTSQNDWFVSEPVPITAGAVRKTVTWRTQRNGKPTEIIAHVIEVDLNSPYVRLDVIANPDGRLPGRSTVRRMAEAAGAVAAANGDFFNTRGIGTPIGPQIRQGRLESGPTVLSGFYAFALTVDRRPIIAPVVFEGTIRAQDGAVFPLRGVNKEPLWLENGGHSHADAIYLYTEAWGDVQRGNDGATVPTEVLVRNGVVEQIAWNGILNITIPQDGVILRASGRGADFIRNHVHPGDRISVEYRLTDATTGQAIDMSRIAMMVGGHTILVDGGKPAVFSREIDGVDGRSPRARTAIGHSKDGRYVLLVAVERSGTSAGATLEELQRLLVRLGVDRAINLDGGGSTQMVARPLGETALQLVNTTETGIERPVVNGIGVFTSAPKGPLAGLLPVAPDILFVGETRPLGVRGYDKYYNPVTPENIRAVWSVAGDAAVITPDGSLHAVKPGTARLRVSAGDVSADRLVFVPGRDDIASISLTGDLPERLAPGIEIPLPKARVVLRDGRTIEALPSVLAWETVGFRAQAVGDRLIMTEPPASGGREAYLIASYEGIAAARQIAPAAEKKPTRILADFDRVNPPVRLRTVPDGVTGTLDRREEAGRGNVLRLSYDFRGGEGTKAVYAVFGNDDHGIPVEGEPVALRIDVKGDGSLNWVRAEVEDAGGSVKWIDLTRNLNWTGWKTLTAPLAEYGLKYPIRLRKIYVANPKSGQDERAVTGEIAFDNVTFEYATNHAADGSNAAGAPASSRTVVLTIGKKTIQIDGKTVAIDQAPVLENNTTMVPVRFVAEALGARVEWLGDRRLVRVYGNGRFVQLGIGDPIASAGGVVVRTAAPPKLSGGRTMVPLRLIAEAMGWRVDWEPTGRSVVLSSATE